MLRKAHACMQGQVATQGRHPPRRLRQPQRAARRACSRVLLLLLMLAAQVGEARAHLPSVSHQLQELHRDASGVSDTLPAAKPVAVLKAAADAAGGGGSDEHSHHIVVSSNSLLHSLKATSTAHEGTA